MATALDKLNPAQLKPGEIEELQQLLNESPYLVGREGHRLELPVPIFLLLTSIVGSLGKGESVVLTHENERLTTQAAADMLDVSRPFLIKLLDQGEIAYDRTGTHRRINLNDLQRYMDSRTRKRRLILDKVYDDIDKAGLYDAVPDGDSAVTKGK